MVMFIETAGIFAPLLFISIHLIRPLFFLPVIFICVSGGILFGTIAGTVYSIIGITLSSVLFYFIILWMPKTFNKFEHVRQKINESTFTISQITLIRLIPFIHFNLISIYLIEISSNLKDYTKSSLLSTIPFAFIYTSIGHWISSLSFVYLIPFLAILLIIIFMIRKKETHIKWQEFFSASPS